MLYILVLANRIKENQLLTNICDLCRTMHCIQYIVFFVRPKTPKSKICFLVPTASYLAYANEKLSFEATIIQPMTGQPPTIQDIDIEQYKNPEFGLFGSLFL